MGNGSVRKIAFIGNHTPRQCGLATFTADIAQAVSNAGVDIQVVAMNDSAEGYAYPPVVTWGIDQSDLESYREAARYLNSQHLDLVCVQHEYGIYGGTAGAYLLTLLRELNVPIVTTLHTILRRPNFDQREILGELAQLSEKLIVMSANGKEILVEVNCIDPSKIVIIPHGIPLLAREDPEPYRQKLGLDGRTILLTFGLMSPDKGIEHMIAAMPKIVESHPEAFYLVVGATHPHVRRHSGEAYRQSLIDLAVQEGVSESVGFVDKYVSNDELAEYLQAASIYVTPYLNKEQITSGTLAYAFGSGKAVVSTPYSHAEELLAGGRGALVPFRDSQALSLEIDGLLSDPALLEAMQAGAHAAGEKMIWPAVGREYVKTFEDTVRESRSLLPALPSIVLPVDELEPIQSALVLDHLLTLTDDTGILQHAIYNVPNRFEGYCTDDNARLAIVGVRLEDELKHAGTGLWLQNKGLSFLHHAFNPATGRMRNFMRYDRIWLEEAGSEDSHGRALWALGVLADESSVAGIRAVAKDLFLNAMPAVEKFGSPRAYAFAILGLDRMLASYYCSDCLRLLGVLGRRLNDLFVQTSSTDWLWFESYLTYDNARLPQALMAAGCVLGNDEMLANSKLALSWLTQVQTDPFGNFLPIGSDGFYRKGCPRALYDQQPLEAAATIDACVDAFRLTDDRKWKREAMKAYEWFLGVNSEQRSLIDDGTGGCRDGLTQGGVNHNQGAESTLAYVASSLAIGLLEQSSVTRQDGFLG